MPDLRIVLGSVQRPVTPLAAAVAHMTGCSLRFIALCGCGESGFGLSLAVALQESLTLCCDALRRSFRAGSWLAPGVCRQREARGFSMRVAQRRQRVTAVKRVAQRPCDASPPASSRARAWSRRA